MREVDGSFLTDWLGVISASSSAAVVLSPASPEQNEHSGRTANQVRPKERRNVVWKAYVPATVVSLNLENGVDVENQERYRSDGSKRQNCRDHTMEGQ